MSDAGAKAMSSRWPNSPSPDNERKWKGLRSMAMTRRNSAFFFGEAFPKVRSRALRMMGSIVIHVSWIAPGATQELREFPHFNGL